MARGVLRIRILGDISDLARGLDGAGSKFERFRQGATLAASAVGAGLLGMAKVVGDAASRQQQALGGLESVFKESTGQMMEWANGAAEAVGLSKTAYASLAAPIGASLKNAGFSMDELGTKTNELIVKGADLAATFGGTTEEAVQALGAALRGEFDPLERYGATLTASQVNAELAAKGLDNLEGAALEAAKKQATLDLIMRQTADSTGQFAREADSAAGAAQIQSAKWEDLQAQLGNQLLPIMTKLAEKFSGVIDFLSRHSTAVTNAAIVLGSMAAAVYAVNGAIAAYKATLAIITGVTKAAKAAQVAYQVAMVSGKLAVMAMSRAQNILTIANLRAAASALANPYVLLAVAIAALVAGIIYLATQTQFFQTIWSAMTGAVTAAWNATVNAIMVGLQAIGGFFTTIWQQGIVAPALAVWNGLKNGVIAAWNFVKNAIQTGINFIQNLFMNFTGPGLFIQHFNSIKNTVMNAINFVVGVIRGGIDLGISIISRLAGVPGMVAGWFSGLPGAIGGALAGIWDKITSPFVTAFNFIRDTWNSTVGGFGFSIGGGSIGPIDIPEVSFHIPTMAQGGVVSAATLAMIGEAGPEAVMPLDRIQPMIDDAVGLAVADIGSMGAGLGGDLHLTVQAGTIVNIDELLHAIREGVRTKGRGSAEKFFAPA